MKIFITGRNGFIATNLRLRLETEGYHVATSSKLDDITIKLNDSRPDIIFHLATENAKFDSDKMVESNILLTHKILEYCRNNTIKKLFVFGSSSEYGRRTHPITEKDTLEPQTIYEGTKACASILSRVYAYTYNIPTVVIRPMSIYGPYEKDCMFMPKLFSKNVKFLNRANHDWTYIDDFVEAIVRIMNYTDTDIFDVVNIGIGVQRTNHEVAEIVGTLMNCKVDCIETQSQKGGLLTILLSQSEVEDLWVAIEANPALAITVNLEAKTVSYGEQVIAFEIDDYVRWRLMEGLDDIGLTLGNSDSIDTFEAKRAAHKPKTLPIRA